MTLSESPDFPRLPFKRAVFTIRPNLPLEITEETEDGVSLSEETRQKLERVGRTLKAYITSIKTLLETKYRDLRHVVPSHMTDACLPTAVILPDGILIRLEDNLSTVQRELGLVGISASPRSVLVIGRSASLTEHNRRKLTTLENTMPKLKIMTYDDVFANARAVAENLLGPLWDPGPNAQVYFLP